MTATRELNLEAALLDPASEFERPMQIVTEAGLASGDKIVALERWAEMLQAQLAATSEGMQAPPGTTSREIALLDEIGKARAMLQPRKSDGV